MTFILRIFFVGLIAFVPRRDGQELTVLLVKTGPCDKTSDGSPIPSHHPMLLAQAGQCWGHCGIRDPDAARFVFPKDSAADAGKFLSAALDHGAVWELDGSDLSIVDAGQLAPGALRIQGAMREAGAAELLPKNADERMDFRWVADLGQIVPSAGAVDPDVLACRPQKELIIARLHLRSARVWTYRLVQVDGMVHSFPFKTLRGEGARAGDSQPLADWVAAEIEVSGDAVEIVENHFASEEIRTIRLAPQNGFVELVVMNIPPPPEPGDKSHETPTFATHFEAFYDLARTPPAKDQRPVPYVAPGLAVTPPVKGNEIPSKLLEELKLGDPKGFYERVICPVAQLSDSGAP